MVTTFLYKFWLHETIINTNDWKMWKIGKNHRILYKGCQILKMDILKLSNSQKNFPLYKKKVFEGLLDFYNPPSKKGNSLAG